MPGLELYYGAFMDLMGSRMSGMGIGSISWPTIQAYCEAYGLDDEQSEAMHSHIKAMDLVYIKLSSRK